MELTSEVLDDPILFAQWATDTHLAYSYQVGIHTMSLSDAEVAQWDINEREIALRRCEFPLMAAAGLAVTIAKNFSFEFYNTALTALCGRLVGLLYGHFSAAFVKDARDNIELYITHLESEDMISFASHYMQRVFNGNPHEGEMFAAEVWKPGFDVMVEAMGASRASIVACLSDSRVNSL